MACSPHVKPGDPKFHWPWTPRYSSKVGGMRTVGDLGHTLAHASGASSDHLKGGAVALGCPAVLQNGIHRWTFHVHQNIWMIGFATDIWLEEQPGCQAKPGCWLLGADGSKNDISGSKRFGEGFSKNTEVRLELWLDGTDATIKVAPEGDPLRTMFSVNFASAPHRGNRIFPVVFALRGAGELATLKLYDGPQRYAMACLEGFLVCCHRATANGDLVYIQCTSLASGTTLAVIPCDLNGVIADLHTSLAEHCGRQPHELILQSEEGCFFTGAEPLTELVQELVTLCPMNACYGEGALIDAELDQIVSDAVLRFTELTNNSNKHKHEIEEQALLRSSFLEQASSFIKPSSKEEKGARARLACKLEL